MRVTECLNTAPLLFCRFKTEQEWHPRWTEKGGKWDNEMMQEKSCILPSFNPLLSSKVSLILLKLLSFSQNKTMREQNSMLFGSSFSLCLFSCDNHSHYSILCSLSIRWTEISRRRLSRQTTFYPLFNSFLSKALINFQVYNFGEQKGRNSMRMRRMLMMERDEMRVSSSNQHQTWRKREEKMRCHSCMKREREKSSVLFHP